MHLHERRCGDLKMESIFLRRFVFVGSFQLSLGKSSGIYCHYYSPISIWYECTSFLVGDGAGGAGREFVRWRMFEDPRGLGNLVPDRFSRRMNSK